MITGGAGYIGSVLVGRLLSKNYHVRTIDNFMFGQNSLDVYKGSRELEVYKGDIRNSADVDKALDGVSCVFHLAAIVGDPACEKNKELATEVNKDGSELLFRKSIEHKVERFVFASTCSNYGRMDDHDAYVDETSPLKPISHYARLKVEFEKYLMSQITSVTKPVILRFATAYGLSPRLRLDLTVNEFTTELALGRKLQVYGEQFWRPYSHTHDLARACIMAAELDSPNIIGRAFNVGGTEENYQKKTLVNLILKQIPQAKSNVEFVHKDEDPRDYRVSFELIKKTFGFQNEKRVENGISELILTIESGQLSDPDNPVYRNC